MVVGVWRIQGWGSVDPTAMHEQGFSPPVQPHFFQQEVTPALDGPKNTNNSNNEKNNIKQFKFNSILIREPNTLTNKTPV
eukprot:m.95804 g.95804  ORF g.95804 m.95804 type:complete len:80 (+) comp12446_c0_seq5:2012-2251(+)